MTVREKAPQTAPAVSDSNNVLQRVILPGADDSPDVRPLYLDEPATVHCQISSRRSVTVPAASTVSFGSYFNAFPASYWKRWTQIDEVILRLSARGSGQVDVYYSKPNGDQIRLDGATVRSPKSSDVLEFRVKLAPFTEGGWIWFDVSTEEAELQVHDAAWLTDQELPHQSLAIGITTIRPNDCVAALKALGQDQAVLDVLEKVFVVDQGQIKVKNVEGFSEAAKLLGDRLAVIEQDNVGGSGGFSRAMYESLLQTNADQIMIMDDDIALETDSLLRSNVFARAATRPVIVGSHMFSLKERTRLLRMGEAVDLKVCFWGPAPGSVEQHDFATDTLRKTRQLHKRIDVNYNGWWMCLIPREVIERIGLPLPLFIKWEDTEHCLRALPEGYPTVTLPGSALWHMPWTAKDDATDWQAYFHVRNRLIVAAMHSPYGMRKALVKEGLRTSFFHLFCMQYSTVAVQQKAIEDFLAGPEGLFDSLRTALPMVRQIRKDYPDAQVLLSAEELPAPIVDAERAKELVRPFKNLPEKAVYALQAVWHNLFIEPRSFASRRPQINLAAKDGRWFFLGRLDSATVSTMDGSGVTFRCRDRKQFRALAARTIRNHLRLAKQWPRMKKIYRSAVPELTSIEAWRKFFEQ